MTDDQRAERGRRAKLALDEFLEPAFQTVIDTYTQRVEELASKAPWDAQKITALANATRIAKQVKAQIELMIYEGEIAQSAKQRAREIEKLSPARRRFLDMVPH
jgi:hypothetical protein